MRILIVAVVMTALVGRGFDERFAGDVINYRQAEAKENPVSQLRQRLDAGEKSLPVGKDGTALTALLAELGVPSQSQVLVFSKTSLQNDYISPQSPRAIYFNDDVYVGTVKGSPILEISAQDKELGAVFYTFDHREPQGKQLIRQTDECLRCHAPRHVEGAPAHMVRSVFPDKNGFPLLRNGSFFTDERSPFEERWGGWYVTGSHPGMTHMGNGIAVAGENQDRLPMDDSGGRDSLADLVNLERYQQPTSDVVALMVLEHQTRIHNLTTLANYQTRLALHDEAVMDKAINRSTEELSPLTRRRIEHYGDKLIAALIFSGEAKLPGPVSSKAGFIQAFLKADPKRDSRGRSLRDLNLQDRLFEYPCSFLINGEGFAGLPQQLKDYVYEKLYAGMTGDDMSDVFMNVSAKEGRAVIEIMRATHPNLPDYWFKD